MLLTAERFHCMVQLNTLSTQLNILSLQICIKNVQPYYISIATLLNILVLQLSIFNDKLNCIDNNLLNWVPNLIFLGPKYLIGDPS